MRRIGAEALTEKVGSSVGLVGAARVAPALSRPKARKRLFKSSRNSLTLFSLEPHKVGGYLSSRTLVEISFPYRPQECEICSAHLATALECCTHLRKTHSLIRPFLVCSICNKSGKRRHEIECHAAKCKGPRGTRTPVVDRVRCSLCSRTFTTQRGLSLHRRSAHTADYVAQLARTAVGQEAPRSRRWSEQEVATLRELLGTWVGGKGFLERAGTVFPDRTPGQIRYKVGQVKKAALLPVPSGPPQNYPSLIEQLMTEKLQSPLIPESMVVTGILRALAEDGGERKYGSSLVQTEGQTQTALQELAAECRQLKNRVMRVRRIGTAHVESRMTLVQRFRYTQKKLSENTRKLAKLVLDGSVDGNCPVSAKEVERHFKSKWEAVDGFRGLGQFQADQFCSNQMLALPISLAEVLRARQDSKSDSAAGPDGVNKVSLVKWDPTGVKLAGMFTGFLVRKTIPDSLKGNRTTLIPKTTDELARTVSNWRPITIGPMVLRLFSSILYKRLSNACPTCVRQKGFSNTPGCSENLLLVEGALKTSSKTGSPLAMVFIDLAKAFDSVSHEHIRTALVQRKVDPAFIDLLVDSYRGCTTRVRARDGYTKRIAMKVGVKQGDPLSPLLFNLAIDPLLLMLEAKGVGFGQGEGRVTVLAYADDLVMLSDSWDGMCKNMGILEAFCNLTGLKVNTTKCHGFFAAGGRRTANKFNNCPPWTLGGANIHMVGPGETVDYLGLSFDPWKGPRQPDIATLVDDLGQKISQARLKPSQRLELFCTYAIPRVLYKAIHSTFRSTCLRQADLAVRRYIKRWLHLSPCTTNGLLYSKWHGGPVPGKDYSTV